MISWSTELPASCTALQILERLTNTILQSVVFAVRPHRLFFMCVLELIFGSGIHAEAARHKSAIIDAVIDKFSPPLPRSRIATAVLPGAAAYFSSCKRWFSRGTLQTLADAKSDSKILTTSLLPAVNSAALQRMTGQGKLPLQLPTKKIGQAVGSNVAVAKGYAAVGGPLAAATTVEGSDLIPVAAKKRRLQPVPIDDQDVPSKQLRTSAVVNLGNAAHGVAHDVCMADCAPADPHGSAPPATRTAAVDQAFALAADGSTRVSGGDAVITPLAVPRPPQPGQGGMEEWMRDNPDRPRLPGGSGDDFCAHDRYHELLTSVTTVRHCRSLPSPPSRIMSRQTWRRKDLKQSLDPFNLKAGLKKLPQQTCEHADLMEQAVGKENKGPFAKAMPAGSPREKISSPLLPRCELIADVFSTSQRSPLATACVVSWCLLWINCDMCLLMSTLLSRIIGCGCLTMRVFSWCSYIYVRTDSFFRGSPVVSVSLETLTFGVVTWRWPFQEIWYFEAV